jgi:sec-independent protein translocase protein TatC
MDIFDSGFISNHSSYFEEFRRKLYFLAALFAAVFLAGFFMAGKVIKIFIKFFQVEDAQIIITSPFQFFGLSVDTALFLSIVIIFPILLFQAFYFLKPALSASERKMAVKFVFISIALFLMGFTFGIALMHFVVEMLASYNSKLGITNLWDINFFVSQVLLTAALLGVMFQFPIVLTILIRLGIVDVENLRKKRRLAFASSFVFSSLLPPTDAVSLIIIALPLILIYELTIFANRKCGVKKVEIPQKLGYK